ncbi:MAG: CRISPR-associated RAMP protein [Crenarchaeota archaeon]|nr:CRISPR-associated RAMP protein [Thermoproteota archaeon]
MVNLLHNICVEDLEWLGHRVICRSVEIEFDIEILEPLRIGVGKTTDPYSPVDLPVLRYNVVTDNGIIRAPVIPGSSFKGVLRTASMLLVATCGMSNVHSGVGDDDCVTALCGSSSTFDNIRKSVRIIDLKRVILGFCPTCLLYGTKSYASHVIVGDFAPRGNIATGIKTGVAINRRVGTAAHGYLYNVEYIESGSRFHGTIMAKNVTNWMLALLSASILLIHNGFLKLGGFKSRGMGRVKIAEESVKIAINPVNGNTLEPLDKDMDESHSLDMCVVQGDTLICEGTKGFKALETLANAWHEKYCSKLKEIYESRLKATQKIVSILTFGG